MEKIFAVLARCPLFSGLDEGALKELLPRLRPIRRRWARGVDFFDCVMPARNARHGKLYTWRGTINIKNEKYKLDPLPIDPQCQCPACRSFSRAYLRHLVTAGEMLAMRLAVLHNLHFYNELMVRIRRALDEGTFEEFRKKYSGMLDRKIEDNQ